MRCTQVPVCLVCLVLPDTIALRCLSACAVQCTPPVLVRVCVCTQVPVCCGRSTWPCARATARRCLSACARVRVPGDVCRVCGCLQVPHLPCPNLTQLPTCVRAYARARVCACACGARACARACACDLGREVLLHLTPSGNEGRRERGGRRASPIRLWIGAMRLKI